MQTAPSETGLPDKAAAGIERLSVSAHEAVDKLAGTASTAARQLGQKTRELSAVQAEWVNSAEQYVQRHPFASLASVGLVAALAVLLFTRPWSR